MSHLLCENLLLSGLLGLENFWLVEIVLLSFMFKGRLDRSKAGGENKGYEFKLWKVFSTCFLNSNISSASISLPLLSLSLSKIVYVH